MSASILKMHSGIYRCPDNIKNFKISVKLKKLHSSSTNSNKDIDLNITEKEIITFSWQEKVFSRSEAEFYLKKNNCVTDLEKHYHEIISATEIENFGRVFSYVQGDDFFPNEESVTTEVKSNISNLHKEMSNLRLRKNTKDNIQTINSGYEINKFLNNSISNPFTTNCYETMHVMADLGASEPSSNIWLKSEHILCRIKYDEFNKLLWVYPDFSSHENDTYTLEIDIGGKLFYEYSIENISELKKAETTEQENNILRKINRRKQEMKTQLLGKEFSGPQINVLQLHIFVEILAAKNFEYDNLYVQYSVDLPENWSSIDENSLFGTTQTCRTRGTENCANFGHYFDVCLEYKLEENLEEVPQIPVIYFQVISRDFWHRFRTEGLTYRTIPVYAPGRYEYTLQCIRLCPLGPSGHLKRYFIGDYFNIDDITWIGVPKEHEGSTINKYGVPTIGTGSLSIRMSVVNQSNASKGSGGHDEPFDGAGVLARQNATSLVKSVAEVVVAFRRAREKMLQARKEVLNEEK